jgi:soluble lytic murein transglycosylase-like protein
MSWQDENEGPTYVPLLNEAEARYGIPSMLLARVAYQESHFRRDVIDGSTKSTAGAVGIMQLLPQYFPGAGVDPAADITTAAVFLAHLHILFGDWQVALASYNWGSGNVHHDEAMNAGDCEFKDMPLETRNYVTQICHDVWVSGSLLTV